MKAFFERHHSNRLKPENETETCDGRSVNALPRTASESKGSEEDLVGDLGRGISMVTAMEWMRQFTSIVIEGGRESTKGYFVVVVLWHDVIGPVLQNGHGQSATFHSSHCARFGC